MRILIINPNSDQAMTEAIQSSAMAYAQGDFEVNTVATPDAPLFIETYLDQMRAAQGMLGIVRKNEHDTDAFVVACHCDPNLDLLKEATVKPVIGIGEASMKLASMLGHRFSVISSHEHSIPNKEAVIRKYHLEGLAASVRAPKLGARFASAMDLYYQVGCQALAEDGAEVLVLGCAGMAGLDKELSHKLGVPVLDGVVCGLIVAAGLARYGIATSKVRRYNPHY